LQPSMHHISCSTPDGNQLACHCYSRATALKPPTSAAPSRGPGYSNACTATHVQQRPPAHTTRCAAHCSISYLCLGPQRVLQHQVQVASIQRQQALHQGLGQAGAGARQSLPHPLVVVVVLRAAGRGRREMCAAVLPGGAGACQGKGKLCPSHAGCWMVLRT
jgi:hypothetical protein